MVPLATAAVIVKVRMTAMGSLLPDSISSVDATRSFICKPRDWKIPKTAAASVELKIAPISKAAGQGKLNKYTADVATIVQVNATPMVARLIAGQSATRKRSG